jgi:hypothetical protein
VCRGSVVVNRAETMVVCGVAVASLSIMLLSSSMQTMPNFGGSNHFTFFS